MTNFDDLFSTPKKENTSIQPFDKEEWIQQKKAEREKAFEMIDQAAARIAKDPERLRIYLDLQSRFPRYSVGNILLLSEQMPNATVLGDSKSWKDAGAYINSGQTGIIILEPGNEFTREDGSTGVSYNAKRVFDVSQTNAKTPRSPEIHVDDRLLLESLIFNAPCEIKINDHLQFPEAVSAVYDPGDKRIYVARGREAKDLFREITRELVHAHLDGDGYNRRTASFSAVCVSYMLCKRNNMDVSAFRFESLPETFMALDSRGVRNELSRMRDLAGTISNGMNRQIEKQKAPKSRGEAR